jgi:hypothetical protein
MSSLELELNRITDDEDKNKSSIEVRLPKPLQVANKKMTIFSSASIAANSMLAVVPLASENKKRYPQEIAT